MPSLTNDEEERETPQPHLPAKIDEIAKLIEKDGPLDKLHEKMATARGTLAQKYQHIEADLHGNRKAVKLVHTLLQGTTDAAYDFMRTFMRLAHRFDLVPEDDLVDMAEKVHERESSPPAKDEDPGVKVSDAAPKKPSATVHELPQRENAIDRASKAMKGGDRPPAPKGPEGSTDLGQAGEDVAKEIEEQRRRDAEAFEEHSAAEHQPAA